MSDKTWLLDRDALSAARQCITLINDELGIRLKLSHDKFLNMVHEYAELTDNAELIVSHNKLAKFAGAKELAIKTTMQSESPTAEFTKIYRGRPVE